MSYDLNKIAKLKVLNELATRIHTRLNKLETADAAIKSVTVDNNALNFFTTTDTSTAAAFTVNLPSEIAIDAETTNLVSSFIFNAGTYVGATNPNLNGKPVLVLGIKTKSNDGQTTTLSYNFIDVSLLADNYTASDTSVVITDNKIRVNVSADSDNMLATTANGLKIDLNGKVDKAASAAGDVVTFAAEGAVSDTGLVSTDVLTKKAASIENNFVVFDANGNITDTGVSIATDAEATEMLDAIFGFANVSVSFSSTSDFFSTDPATFHAFLQNALDATTNKSDIRNDDAVISLYFGTDLEEGAYNRETIIDINYGDFNTLLANQNTTFNDVVTLINNKLVAADATQPDNSTNITVSFNYPTLSLTSSTFADCGMYTSEGYLPASYAYILQSLYDNTNDTSAFELINDSYYQLTLGTGYVH